MEYKTKKVLRILERQGINCDARHQDYRELSICGHTFRYWDSPEIHRFLSELEQLYITMQPPEASIEEVFHTSNLEGAGIRTLDETRILLQNNATSSKPSGMVHGYTEAVAYLLQHKKEPLSVSFANEIQKRIVKYYSDSSQSGYRDNSVFVGNDIEIVHQPCDCHKIDLYYPSVFQKNNYSELTEAALLHFKLVYLHPYFDGNGRSARLLMKEYLVRNGYPKLETVPLSRFIHENAGAYYRALQYSEEDFDVTHFVVYILNILEDALLEYQANTP